MKVGKSGRNFIKNAFFFKKSVKIFGVKGICIVLLHPQSRRRVIFVVDLAPFFDNFPYLQSEQYLLLFSSFF